MSPASLYVPEFAPLPAELLAAVGVNGEPVFRSKGNPAFAVYDLEGASISPSSPADVSFDERIRFLGHDLLEANELEIRLLTYWIVQDALPDDLATFVHLVKQEGEIVAQEDSLDAAPQMLEPGVVLVQLHVLPVTGVSPEGPMALQIGLYQRISQARLTHQGAEADRITIEDELILTKE